MRTRIALLLGLALSFGSLHAQVGSDSLFFTGKVTFDSFPRVDSFPLTAVGDIMLGTNYPNASYLPPNDGQFLLDSVIPYLHSAGPVFGNLEGTYLNTLGPTTKNCKDTTKCYAFRSPEHYMAHVKKAGFTVVSLANNHSGDFGMDGRRRSMHLADSFGMHYAGLENCPYTLFVQNGLTYGFAAFAPNNGCQQLNDLEKAIAIVKHLDSLCDIVIISFHGGAEGSKYQHVAAGTEYYLGENRGDLRKFSHTLIDHGADIILGHGPHVSRGMEVYKERFIAYSLGNFATYGRFNLIGPNCLCPLLQLSTDKEGKFQKGKIIPIRQIGEGIPMYDEQMRVIGLLQDLSKVDFPKTSPIITDQGDILPPTE